MPYVTTWSGFVIYAVVTLTFVVQEFSQGYRMPSGAIGKDDRWSLIYLDVLPVILVTASIVVSFTGWGAWPGSRVVFAVGIAVLTAGVIVRQWGAIEHSERSIRRR